MTEEEYQSKFPEYAPKLDDLVAQLGFLAQYRLVKTGSMDMDKDGDFYKISVKNLMGDKPYFESVDKISEQKITYLGYESGHKPAFPNVNRLPLVIREAAVRRP